MREYNVSLKKQSNGYQVKQADRKERIFEYIKNVWTVRKFFIHNFSVDPPIIKWWSDATTLKRECFTENSQHKRLRNVC